ncbi:tetratricopeptide repeat protein [Enterovirga sp.]|uniref:tetratricopeptide repeat protein n=1 Tax=Enterovirga sp. TaxID=2026350 RepID=UPI003FA5A1F9
MHAGAQGAAEGSAHQVSARPRAGEIRCSAGALAVLFREAAEGESIVAAHNLATLHETGSGVREDQAGAVRLCRVAAEGGLVLSIRLLAAHLHHGRGVGWNKAEAMAWYRRAAEGGTTLLKGEDRARTSIAVLTLLVAAVGG